MFRLQGTDGVRALTALSSREDLRGLTPQEAFLKKGVITEEFMELYAFVRCRQLIDSGAAQAGEGMVIGWDPRDPSAIFTAAAVSGIGKGGLTPWALGVAPTPLCPLYAQYTGAAGAIAITASHNPAVYNGIKIFTRRGLKLLPPDDLDFTRRFMETDYAGEVKRAPQIKSEDRAPQAMELFMRYHLDPVNSMIKQSGFLKETALVVDAANGAMAPFAEETIKKAGFGRVVSLNARLDGSVNEKCGVAELEGLSSVTPEMLERGGKLHENRAMAELFRVGREAPNVKTWAAIFDGDGDRLYMAIYDPARDNARILTGDDTASLLAWGLKGGDGDKFFVNTVESDLNSALAAEKMGYKTELTAVGDKWILMKAALELMRECASPVAVTEAERLAAEGKLSADALEKIMDKGGVDFSGAKAPLFIGGEESGHSITTGYLRGEDGALTPVFHGNGMKCLLNASAWLCALNGLFLEVYEPGFKKTLYAYHVEKSRWRRGAGIWKTAEQAVAAWAARQEPRLTAEEMILPEEPDMLYIKLMEKGAHAASVFIRSSGTEDKTGVSLRGPAGLAVALAALGEELLRSLLTAIKNLEGAMGRAEDILLRQSAGSSGAPAEPVGGLVPGEYIRLLSEAAKQGLLTGATPGARLTPRGEWLLSTRQEAR